MAFAHQLAELQVDGAAVHVRGVDFGALVVIDLEGAWIGEVLVFFRGKKDLLGAPGQLLGVHSHFMRAMLLIYTCHTRTSPS